MNDKNFIPTRVVIITIIIALLVSTAGSILISVYLSKLLPQHLSTPFSLPKNSEQIIKGEKGKPEKTTSTYEPTNKVLTEDEQVVKVVKQASPSVVSIVISKYVKRYYSSPFQFPGDDFFDFGPFKFDFDFYPGPSIPTPVPNEPQPSPQREKVKVGGGTGFVVSSDGLILTNKHVVSDEDASYTVVTNEGKQYEAKIFAIDPFNDLAVLKVENINLSPLPLGDSDEVMIGQTVIAIGNALGEYRNTVTKGVVSGIGRTITAGDLRGRSETLENVIQTDAAINFGNSGGPLINLNGEVVGVNTAIASGGQLIGFAIPINQAKGVINSIKKYGRIVRPFLGVRYVLIDKKSAEESNLPVDYGALIVRGDKPTEVAVVPSSPADIAGLAENDIILEVEGKKITPQYSLGKAIRQYQPGDKITLKVLTKGKEKEIEVTLGEYKEKNKKEE